MVAVVSVCRPLLPALIAIGLVRSAWVSVGFWVKVRAAQRNQSVRHCSEVDSGTSHD